MEYIIADLRIKIPDEWMFGYVGDAFRPFQVECTGEADLEILPDEHLAQSPTFHELEQFDFAEAEASCIYGQEERGYWLQMKPNDGSPICNFLIAEDGRKAWTNFTPKHMLALLRFGVWMAFNTRAIRENTAAFHSSVIVYKGQAVMVLGESGTGKSTHTRLWREHIEGAHLLNDDSPIVHGDQTGSSTVYGSAWSGKTPCYINRKFPIRAFVRLSQAPYNKIHRLRPIQAIGAILPSCPPAFAHDKRLFDMVCKTVSSVLAHTEVYHLECLPDGDAARLVRDTLFPTTEA